MTSYLEDPIPHDESDPRELKSFRVTVERCARCGKDHPGLKFHRFARPLVLPEAPAQTHWASCPKTGEPVTLHFHDPEEEPNDG